MKCRKTRRILKRQRRLSKRKKVQRGGDVIGEGSFGLVTRPPTCPAGTFGEGEIGKILSVRAGKQEEGRISDILSRLPKELLSVYRLYIEPKGRCPLDPAHPDIYQYFSVPPGAPAGISPPNRPEDFVVLRYIDAGKTTTSALMEIFKISNKNIFNAEIKKFVGSFHKVFYSLQILNDLIGNNIAHRDVKPDNITQTVDKELTLIDFGMAIRMEEYESGLLEKTDGFNYPYWPMEAPVVIDPMGMFIIADENIQQFADAILEGKIIGMPGSPSKGIKRDKYQFKYLGIPYEASRIESEIFNVVISVKSILGELVSLNKETFSELQEYILPDINEANYINVYFDINKLYTFVRGITNNSGKQTNKYKQFILLQTYLSHSIYRYFDVFSLGITILYLCDLINKFEIGKLDESNKTILDSINTLAKQMISTNILSRDTMAENLIKFERIN